MAKKKKLKRQNPEQALPAISAHAPFWTPRRSIALSIGALCVMWLIQFFPVLAGVGHFWEDVVGFDYPTRVFARTAFLSGEFPHWTPYVFNGMPFFATQGPGALYPFNIILSLLPVNADAFWRLISACLALHFLIAGVAMFIYLRYKKRTDAASLFGAAAFMLGGFMVTHVVHTMMIYILAWFPLVLLLFERGIREVKFTHAVSGGLLLGITTLAGHPQITFYELIFLASIGVFLLYRLKDRIVKRVSVAAIFFTVAAGLCLVQYLPTVEMNNWTARVDYTVADASEGSLQFVQLLTALIPKVFGAYTGDNSVPSFWLKDAFRHGYYNYWETCFYFGVSTLLLSFLWFRRVWANRAALFALLWVAGSLCIALGGNFIVFKLLFATGVPGFTSFRHPARILLTWGFLFPLMAAAALDSLNELKTSRLKFVTLLISAVFALIGIITAAGGLAPLFPLMGAVPERMQYASWQGFLLMLNAVLIGIVLALFFKDIIKLRTAKILIVACLSIDLLIFAAGQHITRGGGAPAEFARAGDIVASIKKEREKEMFRFSMRQFDKAAPTAGYQTSIMMMNKGQGLVDNVQIVEGYTALQLKHYIPRLNTEKLNTALDLLNVKFYVNPHLQRGEQHNVVLENETRLPRAKLFYRAKIVGAGGDDSDSLVLAYMNSASYDHHNEIVVTNQSFANFIGGDGSGKAEITKYKLNRIEIDVDTDREAILWLSEIWYPAWKATVNGKKAEVHRASYSFRAVAVPAGKSAVVMKFDSPYFNIGAAISLLTLLASLAYLAIAFVGARRAKTKIETKTPEPAR